MQEGAFEETVGRSDCNHEEGLPTFATAKDDKLRDFIILPLVSGRLATVTRFVVGRDSLPAGLISTPSVRTLIQKPPPFCCEEIPCDKGGEDREDNLWKCQRTRLLTKVRDQLIRNKVRKYETF